MLSYLLFAGSHQQDDEDRQHDATQSHENEREVGHRGADQQQLLHSGRRGVIDRHTLPIERQKYWKPYPNFRRVWKEVFEALKEVFHQNSKA